MHAQYTATHSVGSITPTDVTLGSDWELYTGVNIQLWGHIGSKLFKILSNLQGHRLLLYLYNYLKQKKKKKKNGKWKNSFSPPLNIVGYTF